MNNSADHAVADEQAGNTNGTNGLLDSNPHISTRIAYPDAVNAPDTVSLSDCVPHPDP